MHPFLPNAISLVTSLLKAETPERRHPEGVSELVAALRYLSEVNNMAKKKQHRRPVRRPWQPVDLADLVAVCGHCLVARHSLKTTPLICPTCGLVDPWIYVTRDRLLKL